MPLGMVKVEVELKGVPVAVPNAIQRVVMDELKGRCLIFPSELDPAGRGEDGGFVRDKTTDPFMVEHFVRDRLRCVPLRYQISEEVVKTLRLALRSENPTSSMKAVYTGDLIITAGEKLLTGTWLFNPTIELAVLQPGRTLTIEGIRISEGFGREHASYNVGIRGALRYLDQEEEKDVFAPDKGAIAPGSKGSRLPADWSGYKGSSLLMNPRHHMVSFVLPAVPRGRDREVARSVLADVCISIKKRLRLVQGILETNSSRRETRFVVVPAGKDREAVKGTLSVPDETDTIGVLLKRAVYELTPDIHYVGYTAVRHERVMKLTLTHGVDDEDIRVILLRAVKHVFGIFDSIQRQVLTH